VSPFRPKWGGGAFVARPCHSRPHGGVHARPRGPGMRARERARGREGERKREREGEATVGTSVRFQSTARHNHRVQPVDGKSVQGGQEAFESLPSNACVLELLYSVVGHPASHAK
jgi:hypothetical protein